MFFSLIFYDIFNKISLILIKNLKYTRLWSVKYFINPAIVSIYNRKFIDPTIIIFFFALVNATLILLHSYLTTKLHQNIL